MPASTSRMTEKQPLVIAAVGLGAFLTFLVQPLAARALLPSFGGSGSVWVTALVFYQVILAVGYLLSHFVHTRFSIRRQTTTLVLLSVGALLTLSIVPKPADVGGDSPAMQLLLSLATSVGFPLLVLAVAGPLIQGWAATECGGTSTGRDIYSLYAVSNGASLLALASYPFVIEPLLGIPQQGRIWSGLFVAEVLLLVGIAWRVRVSDRRVAAAEDPVRTMIRSDREAGLPRTLGWLAWSAAGVMVLTSTSGVIGQEIAAIPMLWVIPLSLYLLTWILTFSGIVRPGVVACVSLTLAALGLIVLAVDYRLSLNLWVEIGFALTGMTLACLAVHASLYRQRPEPGQLTRFYAAVATGGAVGGIFAGVVAIQLFQDWTDLALAFSLVALLSCGGLVPRLRGHRAVHWHRKPAFWLAGLVSIGCCYLFVVTGMVRPGTLYKQRDFHGLVQVVERDAENPLRHRLLMFHGATMHGNQFLDPDLRTMPTTYFGHGTGAEIAVEAQRVLAGGAHGLDIGVVGLGIGTMAAHLQEQDSMRFYELSPKVADLAQGRVPLGNSGHRFSYLNDAAGEVDIVVGDARLSLAAELTENPAGHSFDLLVLDAFAGDAVPLHLLTREAFSLFVQHLSDDGMIAVHVSSNWLDLVPVVYAWAESERWQALTISTRGTADGVSGNHAVWMLLFQNQAALRILAGQCQPLMAEGKIMVQNLRNVRFGDLSPWTDDRSDLLALMRSKIRLREGLANQPG